MDAAIITQCLDIANKLNTKKAKFDINIKLEAGYFRLSSDGKYDVKEEKHWTKSLKQTKRDSLRKQEFLKQKMLFKTLMIFLQLLLKIKSCQKV